MGKTANKQMICEVLMEAAKEDKDIVALCSYVSGTIRGNRDCRTESGQYCSRTCKMWKEILCGFTGMLPFYKKL